MIDVFFDHALRYDRDCFQRASSREFVVREGLGWEPTILP